MCSAGVHRCRAQCDVLVIPQLVTIVPHLFCLILVRLLLVLVLVFVLVLVLLLVLVVVVILVVVVLVLVLVLATQRIFALFVDPQKSSNRLYFRTFLKKTEQKQQRNDCVFLRLGNPKPWYLRCSLLLVAKVTVFTMFYCHCVAKTLAFTQFSPCCKM